MWSKSLENHKSHDSTNDRLQIIINILRQRLWNSTPIPAQCYSKEILWLHKSVRNGKIFVNIPLFQKCSGCPCNSIGVHVLILQVKVHVVDWFCGPTIIYHNSSLHVRMQCCIMYIINYVAISGLRMGRSGLYWHFAPFILHEYWWIWHQNYCAKFEKKKIVLHFALQIFAHFTKNAWKRIVFIVFSQLFLLQMHDIWRSEIR